MSAPAVFERERRVSVGEFTIYVDRKASAFVSLRSGLSHRGGSTQWIMSPADAKALGEHLIAAAEFGSIPMPADTWGKGQS